MSLQFIMGGSGAGKSTFAYRQLVRESMEQPERLFYCIVPEQFTMATQRALVEIHPGGGILNIDVLSFQRLAYRVFEEVGGDTREILEDDGKSMVIEKLAQDRRGKLPYLGGQMHKPGFIDEVKSLLSEFMQYAVREDKLEEILKAVPEGSLLSIKMRDIAAIYEAFQEYLGDHYVTNEEVLTVMLSLLPESERLRGSVMVFDGFTGFTPVQMEVMAALLSLCDQVRVTVTMDVRAAVRGKGKSWPLFFMSREMIDGLSALTKDILPAVLLEGATEGAGADRFSGAPANAGPGPAGVSGSAGTGSGTEALPAGTASAGAGNASTSAGSYTVVRASGKDIVTGPDRFSGAPALRFLERHLFRYDGSTFPGAQNQVRLFACDSPYLEMEETARRIRALVRREGLKYGEIAVITGDLESYGNTARQVFSEAGIPFFVDEKHNVLMNPFVEWIRAALEVVTRNYAYEGMMRYLRSGFSSLAEDETDKVDNYVRAVGIRGKKKWSERWIRIYRRQDPKEVPVLEEYRSMVMEELSALSDTFTGAKRPVSEYCQALRAFLERAGAKEKLEQAEIRFHAAGKGELEKEYAQIYDKVTGLLDKLEAVLGQEKAARADFVRLLEMGLSKIEIGLVPPSIDQVLVGDMERTRLPEIKALFFVGVNEGNIPKNPETGGFLTQMDRDFLKEHKISLAPGPRERIAMGKYYLYLNLTKPSRLLVLSYSRSSGGGEPLRPAYLVGTMKDLFPGLAEEVAGEASPADPSVWAGGISLPELPGAGLSIFAKGLGSGEDCLADPLFLELYSWYLKDRRYAPVARRLVEAAFARYPGDVIGRRTARALYGEISPYSATRLERYAACAYQHFLLYGMRLTERAEYEFRALDMGNVMHGALERFALELKGEGLSWAELEAGRRDGLVESCVEKAAADYGNAILQSSARDAYMVERAKRILKKTAWVLQEQLKNGQFQPESFELAFEGGRIDRVDISREGDTVYVKIVDYKTGSTRFSLEKIYHGLQLQLVLYMDAALKAEGEIYKDCEIVPAGIFYYRVDDPVLEPKDTDGELADAVVKKLKMDGLVNADPYVFEKLDSTKRSIPVSLNKDGSVSKASAKSLATREQFDAINQYVHKKIQDELSDIMDGDCRTAPYRLGTEAACQMCGLKGSCGFDPKVEGYRYRNLEALEPEEVWRRMEADVRRTAANADGGDGNGDRMDG